MKKGLLSILALAVTIVGCQNYDDQFDALNTQITALKSQVDGLAAVQSAVTALQGQLASLSSAALTSADLDAALSSGLADIIADVEAVQAAVADVASAADVSAINDAVTDAQADLDELLANSSVFTGDVVVSSPSLLDTFHQMGSTLNIVNGSVDIDVTTEMDMTKVQELVDNILTTTKAFSYTAGTGVDTEVTFNNLTGTQTLTLQQEGGYVLQNLQSATVVTLEDDSSVDIVDLRALTSVTSLSDGTAAGTFTFSKATELHLTALPRYKSNTFKLGVDEGGVIDITALRDVDADGDDQALDLTIEGPSSLTISELSGDKASSSITLKDVASATINGYDGTVNIGDDVQNFTSNNLVDWSVTGDDLVTVNVTGKKNPNASPADKQGPNVALSSDGDLESVTIAGDVGYVNLSSNGNLSSVTISAHVDDALGIVIHDNSDLASITTTGAKAEKIHVTENSDLEALTIDLTATDSDDTGSALDMDVKVHDNESLASLTVTSNNIEKLDVTDNVDLETIDFTGVDAIGATGKAVVTIKDNKLEASLATNEEDGATAADDVADGAAGDLGSFTTNSGMETLKEYLTAVQADSDSNAEVVFDEVSSVVDSEGTTDSETTDVADYIILKMKPMVPAVITGAYAGTTEKRSWIIDVADAAGFQLTIDGVDVLHNGSGYGVVSTTSNQIIQKGELLTSLARTRATDLGATLDVVKGGNYTLPAVTFLNTVNSVTNGEVYSDNAANNLTSNTSYLTTYDEFTITVGGRSARASVTGATSSAASAIADALAAAWGKKWASDGASANFSFWTTGTQTDGNAIIEAFSLRSSNSGSRASNDAVSISWSKATAAQVSIVSSGARTESVIDWTIGATDASDDNGATSTDLILSLTEVDDAVISSGKASLTRTDGDYIHEITTNLLVNASAANTDTTSTIYPTDGRGDAVANEASAEGITTTPQVDAVNISRIGWLD
ncbi:MAG: hypothetical protein ACON5F_00010 [Jejuia sp.]